MPMPPDRCLFGLATKERMNIQRMVAGLLACAACSAVPAAEPIKIGFVAEVTSSNAETGAYQVNGARLAVEEINLAGGVLGRPLTLQIEDNQSTNTGSLLAFANLTEDKSVIAAIGPNRSTQILAMMPAILAAGIPTMIGGTDYTLTHAGNPWVFRARPHDGHSAKAMANFGVNLLNRRKWAIVYTADAFGIGGKNFLVEALQKFGMTPILVQSLNDSTQDFTPIVRAIKQSGADMIATYVTRPNDVAALARKMRQEDIQTTLIGSPSMSGAVALRIGGDALHGSYSVSDFAAEASPEAASFAKKYKEKSGLEASHYSSWTYDAIHLLAAAIKSANSTRPDAIRKALLAINGYKGAQGLYRYDANGDGLHGYNIVKNEQGKIVFIMHYEPK
jgi:branched-chain amino acid transport system substrate-binding protein